MVPVRGLARSALKYSSAGPISSVFDFSSVNHLANEGLLKEPFSDNQAAAETSDKAEENKRACLNFIKR